MAIYGDPPYPGQHAYGPIWMDPRYFHHYRPQRPGPWERWEITTTDHTTPHAPPQPVDEDRIRRIVREEIARLPIKFDVPDALPEDAP
jgi:hypothetical protein